MNTWSNTLVENEPRLKPLHRAYEQAIRSLRNYYTFDYEQADYIVGLLLQRHKFQTHNHIPGLEQIHSETADFDPIIKLYEVADAMSDEELCYYLD